MSQREAIAPLILLLAVGCGAPPIYDVRTDYAAVVPVEPLAPETTSYARALLESEWPPAQGVHPLDRAVRRITPSWIRRARALRRLPTVAPRVCHGAEPLVPVVILRVEEGRGPPRLLRVSRCDPTGPGR